MRASKDFILREIAGEYILIPLGKAALKIHGMINLSDGAAYLWKMLQTHCTEAELIDGLLAEFEIDRDTAAADVRSFVADMNKMGILE